MDTEKTQQTQPCEICGSPETLLFGDQWICEDCYQGRSSCCPEFGKDDLWTFDEDQAEERETEVCLRTSGL